MPGAKPCLGYPSRTDAVVALRASGLTAAAIAAKIGIDIQAVQSLEASRRRQDRQAKALGRAPGNGPGAPKSIIAEALNGDHNLLARVRQHAAVRGITLDALANRILDAVIAGDLLDAVLDDADDLRRA